MYNCSSGRRVMSFNYAPTGIELLAEMCGGRLKGEGIGSSEVTLCPQAIRGGHFTADTRTAG